MAAYGLIGWLIGRAVGVSVLFPIGMLAGLAISLGFVIWRYGRNAGAGGEKDGGDGGDNDMETGMRAAASRRASHRRGIPRGEKSRGPGPVRPPRAAAGTGSGGWGGGEMCSGWGFPDPGLQDFIWKPIFTIGSFEFTKPMLLAILAALIVIGFFWAAFRKPKLIPGRIQSLGEMAILAVRDQILR